VNPAIFERIARRVIAGMKILLLITLVGVEVEFLRTTEHVYILLGVAAAPFTSDVVVRWLEAPARYLELVRTICLGIAAGWISCSVGFPGYVAIPAVYVLFLVTPGVLNLLREEIFSTWMKSRRID